MRNSTLQKRGMFLFLCQQPRSHTPSLQCFFCRFTPKQAVLWEVYKPQASDRMRASSVCLPAPETVGTCPCSFSRAAWTVLTGLLSVNVRSLAWQVGRGDDPSSVASAPGSPWASPGESRCVFPGAGVFAPRPDYAGYRCYHNYTIHSIRVWKESGCFYESQMGMPKKVLVKQ